MIKVYFKCENCGCTQGRMFAFCGNVEVECVECNRWEILKDNYPEPNTEMLPERKFDKLAKDELLPDDYGANEYFSNR
jgi:predicted ATP-dependent serine protease